LYSISIPSNIPQLGKTLYHQGDLSYFEAVNKETLKNAWTRFEEEGIITVLKSKNSKTPPRTRLSADWTPRRDPVTGLIVPEGRLWDFIEKIAQSRREGKNRKDGATVSSRVLRLTEIIGKSLFDSDRTADHLSEEDQTTLNQTQMRRKAMGGRSKL
jgi:hypothetical protein